MTLKDSKQETDEETVRVSEEKYKALYDNAPLSYQSLNEDGNFNDVNPAWLRTLGYDRKEVIGKWFGDFLHPDWKPHFEKNFQEFKRRGYVHDVQFKIRHKDGHYLDISFEGYIGYNPDGSFKQTYCVFQDITEHKQVEEALKYSESSLASAQRIAHLGCWTFELATSVVKWSDELYRIFGLDPESEPPVWPDGHEHLYHPDDWACSKDTIEKSIAKGESYSIENRIIRETDGAVLHTIALGNPKYSNDGSIKEYVGTVQDITEHKQAEDALRESEENLRAILDASPDVIHLLDINGIILSTNDGFAKRVGLEIDDVIGKCVFDYVPTESLHNRKAAIEKVFRTGEPLKLEDRGLTGIFESHIHPVFNPAGEVTAVAVYARDITERKQSEKMLQRSESLLNATQQLSKVGGWEWDVEKQTMFWSDEVYRIHDFQPSEFTPGSMEHIEQGIECYDPEDRPVIMEAFRNCAEKGKAYDIEFPFTTALGRRIWIRTVANPVLKDEKVVKITGNIIDITERKQAEIALRESEEQFRTMFEQSPLAIHIYTPDGWPVEGNSAFMKLWGFDEKTYQVIKENWNIFKDEQAITLGYMPLIKQAFNGTEVTLPEMIFDSQKALSGLGVDEKNTLKRWIQPHYYPVKNDQGEVILVVAMIENITERKQAEEEIRLHAAMMDNVAEGIYLVGLDDLIIKWTNEKFERMFGYDPREMVGKQVDIVNAPTEKTPTETRISIVDVLKETGEWHGEVRNIKRDGTHFWCYANVSLFDHPGYGKVIVSVHTDITERKQAEKALRQSEQDLRLRNQINNIFLTYPDEEIYAEILELIRKAMESKYGTFGYFDENGSFVAPAVTRKIYWDKCNVPEKNIIFEKGTFGGIWGRAIKERKTLISNDGPFNTPKGHIPIENTIVTPIIFHDEVISAIHIANKPNGYDEKDRAVLETIADQIAPVLYARLQRDRRNMQRKQAEKALLERIKELKCLYNIAEISNRPEIALDELFQESVSLLPLGWQYPEITGSRITVDGKVYSTKNFKETKWMQREDIHTTNEIFGTVEVCYLKEKPDENEGPFLEEERKLIKNIAGQLGEHITRKQAEEELHKRMNELETFYRTTLGREERVIEMKQEVNELLEQLGKNKKYRDYSKE